MTNSKLLAVLTLAGMAAALSCDSGSSATNGAATPDCPIGTFRPPGVADCVFPADDQNGNPLGVSDNRCAVGQPAVPPVCVSDSGGRSYLTATPTCAPSYRYEPGACERGGGTGGIAGSFFAGTGGVEVGAAGSFDGTAGVAGSFNTGFGTGEAGASFGDAGAGGFGDTGGTAGSNMTTTDASADAMSIE